MLGRVVFGPFMPDDLKAFPPPTLLEISSGFDAGTDIYLLGNGYAPTLTVRNPAGKIVFRDTVPFLPQDANLTSLGIVKVPDGLAEQVGLSASPCWRRVRALEQGDVGPVTAAMWSAEVLVGAGAGFLVLGDHIRPGWVVPAVLGMAITLAGTFILAGTRDQAQSTKATASHPR